MDLGLSIGVGLMIFGVGLYSRKWAGWLSFFGVFPFWAGAASGILGFMFDSAAIPGITIIVTYGLGVALGWIAHFIIGKLPAND